MAESLKDNFLRFSVQNASDTEWSSCEEDCSAVGSQPLSSNEVNVELNPDLHAYVEPRLTIHCRIPRNIPKLRGFSQFDAKRIFHRFLNYWEKCRSPRQRRWLQREFQRFLDKHRNQARPNYDKVLFCKIMQFGFWHMHTGKASDEQFQSLLHDLETQRNKVVNFDLLLAMLYTAASQMWLQEGDTRKAIESNEKAEGLVVSSNTTTSFAHAFVCYSWARIHTKTGQRSDAQNFARESLHLLQEEPIGDDFALFRFLKLAQVSLTFALRNITADPELSDTDLTEADQILTQIENEALSSSNIRIQCRWHSYRAQSVLCKVQQLLRSHNALPSVAFLQCAIQMFNEHIVKARKAVRKSFFETEKKNIDNVERSFYLFLFYHGCQKYRRRE